MISAFVLPFDKKGKEMEVNGINFLNVDTTLLQSFYRNSNSENTSKVTPDIYKLFSGLISFKENRKPVQLSLFLNNISETIQNLGVFYLEDETILPVRFSSSPAFDACCDYLLNNNKGSYYFIINDFSCKGHPCDDYISKHNPFQELGSWIARLAPKGYAQINDSYLKENYLAQFTKLDVPKAEIDFDLLVKQWKALIAKEDLSVSERAVDTSIYEQFNEETGLEFPKELKVLLCLTNGVKGFPEGREVLSADNVLQEWKNWKAIYQSFNFLDLVDDYHFKYRNDKMVPMYVNPFRVPFIHDGGGNFIGIDLLPNKAGNKGQIIAFGVDEIMVRCIAENMNDFLQQFLDGKNPLENDKYNNDLVIGF